MKVLKQILPHWSISVALIAVLIASSSSISTTNKKDNITVIFKVLEVP